MDRTQRLTPLGPVRLRLLDCLGGNSRWAPGYFDPPAEGNIFDAFRGYVQGLGAQWGQLTDPTAVALLAAARLMIGDITAAREILERLPEKPIKLDHGAGQCLIAAPQTLRAALPLPAELSDSSRWLAGSDQQKALLTWLSEHERNLRWQEESGSYTAVGT
jgi:hypothetical protein